MGLRCEVLVTGKLEVALATDDLQSGGIGGTVGHVNDAFSPLFWCKA